MESSAIESQAVKTRRSELPWGPIGLLLGLAIIGYLPVLQRLFNQWMDDGDMGHGAFVPVLAAYFLWNRREELARVEMSPSKWGWLILAYGLFQLMIGTLGVELFLQRTAFIITLVGVVWTVGGAPLFRAIWFELFLLVFMVPIPAIVYNHITFPLQQFASVVAEYVLLAVGIPVVREGNIIELASQKLQVVEACSGIRSLLTLTFLSVVYAELFDPKKWMRWALLVAAVPIAVVSNSARVSATGILSEINPELARGFFHTFEGWVVFVFALALLVGAHYLINFVYTKLTKKGDPPVHEQPAVSQA